MRISAVLGRTRIVIAGCLALVLAAANPYANDGDPAAREAAAAWLTLLDAGDYEATWNEAARVFQSALGADVWAQQATAVRQQVGELVSRAVTDVQEATDPPGAPPGRYINIRYESEFSEVGAAMEMVALLHEDERGWRVAGYFVQPPVGE